MLAVPEEYRNVVGWFLGDDFQDIFQRAPWYLAVTFSMSATPEEHKKIGMSGRRLHGRCLVPQWIHGHASVHGVGEFTRFLRKGRNRISRLMRGAFRLEIWILFPRPFVPGTHLFGIRRLRSTRLWIFLEMISRKFHLFVVCMVDGGYKFVRVVHGGTWKKFAHFLREGGIWIPSLLMVSVGLGPFFRLFFTAFFGLRPCRR